MAKRKRTAPQRERDLNLIYILHLAGNSSNDIPKLLQEMTGSDYLLSGGQIRTDLLDIKNRLATSTNRNLNEEREKALLELEMVKMEMWKEWLGSRKSKQTKAITQKNAQQQGLAQQAQQGLQAGPQGQVNIQTMLKSEERFGDPRYLSGVMEALRDQCKILGLSFDRLSISLSADTVQTFVVKLLQILKEELDDSAFERVNKRITAGHFSDN